MKKLMFVLMVVGFVSCKKSESVSTGVDSVKVDTSVVDTAKDSTKTDSAK